MVELPAADCSALGLDGYINRTLPKAMEQKFDQLLDEKLRAFQEALLDQVGTIMRDVKEDIRGAHAEEYKASCQDGPNSTRTKRRSNSSLQ